MLFFAIGLFSAALMEALMLSSVFSDFRFWPPGERNWKWLLYWVLAGTNGAAFVLIFASDFFEHFSLIPIFLGGFFIASAGTALNLIALYQLGIDRSSGMEDQIEDSGIYRYSRNPQVLGNLMMLIGAIIMIPTAEMVSVSFLTSFWLVTMVFAEEPWLKDKYGEKYTNYVNTTPRFFGKKFFQIKRVFRRLSHFS